LNGDRAGADNPPLPGRAQVVLNRGDGRTELFFQGLWYADELIL
jgi:hypothetical protein